MLIVGAGGGPFLLETARYRLKHCPKGPLSPKQPTNHPFKLHPTSFIIIPVDELKSSLAVEMIRKINDKGHVPFPMQQRYFSGPIIYKRL